jgi:cell division protein FtsN
MHVKQVRPLAALAVLGLLAACATQAPVDQSKEAARYLSASKHDYTAPGPSYDPWRPYIAEASQRYDVPERWVREVMRVESGGKEYVNGQLTTSPVGAMGLMQIMPETYDALRLRYGLGDDPYDPHDNILAGAAYLREMYDVYGSPGFLAAYNAGPQRLDDYLNRNRPLPDETRRYVAMIGPYIRDSHPNNPSPADSEYAMAIPIDIPPGPRRQARSRTQYASRATTHQPHGYATEPVQVAELPEPPRAPAVYEPKSHGFHLIPQANAAESVQFHHGAGGSGNWAIQVGAFSSQATAANVANAARGAAHGGRVAVEAVQHGKLYRARLVGLSRDSALEACSTLKHSRTNCAALSPEAQD